MSKDRGLAGDLAAREREHFERAYAVYLPVTTRVTPDNFQRDEDGDEYVHTIVQVAWSMWCARALANPVATPPSVLQQALSALQGARLGLEWYWDMHPEDSSPSDAEMGKEIDAAIVALIAALAATATGEPTDATENAKLREAPVSLAEVEQLARQMWKDEVLPGRVLRFGAAVLGLVDAALAASKPSTLPVWDGGDEDEYARILGEIDCAATKEQQQ